MTTKINTDVIEDGAITNSKIESVATSKLTGTITTAQIANGQITEAKLSSGAGSANQVLTTNGSGTLAWVDAAGGAWKVLAEGNTTSPTYGTTLNFTGLSGYKWIRFIGNIKGNTTSTQQLRMRFSNNNGSTWNSSTNQYFNSGLITTESNGIQYLNNNGDTAFLLSYGLSGSWQEVGMSHNGGSQFDILIHQKSYPTYHLVAGPFGNSNWTSITNGPRWYMTSTGISNSSGTPNAFQIFASSLGLLSYTILGAE